MATHRKACYSSLVNVSKPRSSIRSIKGIDVIPGMIEVSQQKAAQAHETITFN
jgi:hypothetical protein